MTLQPAVRIILTFIVATLSCLVGLVDNETVRVICLPLIAGLAAVGIVPPQVPTQTVVAAKKKLKSESGYANNNVLIFVVVVVVLTIVAVHFLGFWGLIVALLLILLLVPRA